MAFRSIHSLATEVLRKTESERAAVKVAQGMKAADQASPGDDGDLRPAQDEPTHLLDDARGLEASSKGNTGKMASTEAPAKFHGRRQTETGREVTAISASPNTMSGSMTAARRRTNEVIPASAAVIDLGMERARRHAAASF